MRYLLITFYRKAGGQIDEHAKFTKRVRTSDIQTCNIIMDYGLRKVDKCVVENKKLEKTFEELHQYYKKIYPIIIEQLEKEGPISAQRRETGK